LRKKLFLDFNEYKTTMENLVIILVNLFLLYLLIGFLFAIPFAWKGVGKIDDGAKDVPRGFRFLIIPGSIALWPYLLIKWIKSGKQ